MYIEEAGGLSLRDVLQVMQNRIVARTTYFGVKALKSPIDAWVYQELIVETKPDVIIEVGVAHGGATLMLAHMCDNLGHGRVIGVDVSLAAVPSLVRRHPRITLVENDACEGHAAIAASIGPDERALVIEDSSHTYENTLKVLRTYAPLVKRGGYFIVEDGICHHGLDLGPSPGPFEAVEQFLQENLDFMHDRFREDFLITWNPQGYLRRIW